MNIPTALDVWQRASEEEIGLVLTLDDQRDMESVKATLYKARQIAKNPAYNDLVLCLPADAPNEFIIVKKTTELD